MATYTKRGKSYRIRVSVGYTPDGKQVMKSRTWTPGPDMTQRQTERELTRQMVLFEEQCRGASVVNGHVKLEAFTRQWMDEHVETSLSLRTQENYRQALSRINAALGHLYIDKITPRQIQKFINGLSEPGSNQKSVECGLSPRYIRLYRAVLSSVFAYAVKSGMIQMNPCHGISLPPVETGSEKKCYTLEEAQAFLDALKNAPLKWQTFFSLALFGGFRREELCGFEFDDFHFDYQTVSVCRASVYTKEQGIVTVPTKTAGSCRTLKLPAWIFDLIERLRIEQIKQRLALGDQWHEHNRLFTGADGSPMNPNKPYLWLRSFCQKEGLPFYGIHQFRHLNASLLIYNNEDIKTVSAALGHSNVSTTLNIYAHTFAAAQARACDALAESLPVKFDLKQA